MANITYTLEQYQFIANCFNNPEIPNDRIPDKFLEKWSDHGKEAVRTQKNKIIQWLMCGWSIEELYEQITNGRCRKWTDEEDAFLWTVKSDEIMDYETHIAAIKFYEEFKGKVFFPNTKICSAKLTRDQLCGRQRFVYGKRRNQKFDVTTWELDPGIYIVNPDEVNSGMERIPVICYAFGHETVKINAYALRKGCKICSAAGQMSLTELKNHPLGQQPAYIYGVHFKDLIGKTGHCDIKGVKQRGARYPDYKIDREVLTTLFHARRIEAATQNEANRIPMYEPLKGNGGTECFEEKEYHKALGVLDREIKCLK